MKKPIGITFSILTIVIVMIEFYIAFLRWPLVSSLNSKVMGVFSLFFYNLPRHNLLWLPLINFILIQIGIQIIICLVSYFLSKKLIQSLTLNNKHLYVISITVWVLIQFFIVELNNYYYPHSVFSILLNRTFNSIAHFILLIMTGSLIALLTSNVFIRVIIDSNKKTLISAGFFIFLVTGITTYQLKFHDTANLSNSKKPNIIIVIADSLRPDFIGHNQSVKTPHLNQLISNSIYFSNTYTPLGRTTPAFISLLTAQYPKNHNVRFNLTPEELINKQPSLIETLRKNGYYTVLATDSTQFFNIYDHYKFDEIIKPKSGLYDYVFSLVNDIPISNLLTNTLLGKLFFPYNYANRSAYITYSPHQFILKLQHELQYRAKEKPLLLVTFLSATHWPYVWAQQPFLKTLPDTYRNAIETFDNQLGEFLEVLKKEHLLNYAVVVVLSDHGESLGLPHDRMITLDNYQGKTDKLRYVTRYNYSIPHHKSYIGVDTALGHGTDVLSISQFKILLSMQFYGFNIKPKIINESVSLLDITPTLIDFLKLPPLKNVQGFSLMPFIEGTSTPHPHRIFYLETEFDAPLIDMTKKSKQSMSNIINQFANLYHIDEKSLNLVLKPNYAKELLRQKQRAVFNDDWLLGYFPGQYNQQMVVLNKQALAKSHCITADKIDDADENPLYLCTIAYPSPSYFILVNRKTGKWDMLYSNEVKKRKESKLWFQKLKWFYRNEIP